MDTAVGARREGCDLDWLNSDLYAQVERAGRQRGVGFEEPGYGNIWCWEKSHDSELR